MLPGILVTVPRRVWSLRAGSRPDEPGLSLALRGCALARQIKVTRCSQGCDEDTEEEATRSAQADWSGVVPGRENMRVNEPSSCVLMMVKAGIGLAKSKRVVFQKEFRKKAGCLGQQEQRVQRHRSTGKRDAFERVGCP